MGVAIMIKTNALIILLAMLAYAMIYLMANVKEKQIIYRCVFSILAVLMIYVLF